MQSIFTKKLGATNTKGSRIRASSTSGISVIVAWDYALDCEDNHHAAALALARKLGWFGAFYAGADRKGFGNIYVIGDSPAFTVEKTAAKGNGK